LRLKAQGVVSSLGTEMQDGNFRKEEKRRRGVLLASSILTSRVKRRRGGVLLASLSHSRRGGRGEEYSWPRYPSPWEKSRKEAKSTPPLFLLSEKPEKEA